MTPAHTSAMEKLGLFVGVMLTLMVAFVTVAPFFVAAPEVGQRLIDQQQTMLQTVFIALASFLYGTSVGNRQKDSTIDTLARTAQTAGVALSGGTDSIVLPPGASATATATSAGTVISPDPP